MKTCLSVLIGVASLAFAAPAAQARSIVIDQGQFLSEGSLEAGCTIGSDPCAPATMPFSFDFGAGATNQAYIYNSGIISFGAPIPSNVDPSSDFTSFGVPVIAPLYVPGTTNVSGPYEVSAQSFTSGNFFFPTTSPILGTDVFQVNFLDPSTFDPNTSMEALISVIISSSGDAIRFEYIHGMVNTLLGTEALPNTTGTVLGYSFDGQTLLDTAPDLAATHSYTISAVGGAVPEPATWAMMLLGFGVLGASMRRNRVRVAIRQSA